MKKRLARLLVVTAALAALVLPAAPASAVADFGADFGSGGVPPYSVTGACTFVAEFVGGAFFAEWAGFAIASGPVPAASTKITCTLKQGGSPVAGSTTALPGNVGATGGVKQIPFTGTTICAAGSALFINGQRASFNNC